MATSFGDWVMGLSPHRRSQSMWVRVGGAGRANLKDVDEVDISVVTFNTAAILYQLHEYACALSVLEPLYDNIEPVDERPKMHPELLEAFGGNAVYVCGALKDNEGLALHLISSLIRDVIHYLEKSFGVGQMTNQTDSGSIVQHQSTNQGSKVSSWSSTPPEVSSSESSASGNVNENPIAGTLSDDS
ncbi:hypothetical protein HPP92_000472 [Vanilla planifolia]|uniref:Uncharacterized protein n=1 Tax=Vanilla planifolia TaxID=51239 RepID=A0A835RWB0_VANPL|nr:hypothetical protein HPP92_000472 [Vanilla planifolia]